jgi:hypothetical protein
MAQNGAAVPIMIIKRRLIIRSYYLCLSVLLCVCESNLIVYFPMRSISVSSVALHKKVENYFFQKLLVVSLFFFFKKGK